MFSVGLRASVRWEAIRCWEKPTPHSVTMKSSGHTYVIVYPKRIDANDREAQIGATSLKC